LLENGQPRRTTAHAMAALCVGGMVLARAMLDRTHADELRDACMSVALDLGGWNKVNKLKNGKSQRSQRLRAAAP
jgi:TetR/AcrR family transcriptional repressor of nem operon